MYYLGVIKVVNTKSKTFKDIDIDMVKIRALHPLGALLLVLLFIWFGLTNGFINREIWDIREIFVLF